MARTGTAAGILPTLAQLADDPEVHGIILQTPLPEGANLAALAAAIPPAKDVDGASPESIGRLVAGLPAFAPATAEAVLALLDHYGVELRGRHAVVVGRSVVVGKPAAHLLLDRHATVTICHSRTADLPAITRQADVLVAAVGRAGPDRPRPRLPRHHGHRRGDERRRRTAASRATWTRRWPASRPRSPRCPAASARSPRRCCSATWCRPPLRDRRGPSSAAASSAQVQIDARVTRESWCIPQAG